MNNQNFITNTFQNQYPVNLSLNQPNSQNIHSINNVNYSGSQVNNSLSSHQPHRSRIYSYQDQNKNKIHQNPKIINLQEFKQKRNKPQHKQSHGIMNHPQEYIMNKYTFKNDKNIVNDDNSFCLFHPCCSMIKQTQRQVYLSPTQLISNGFFYKNLKTQPKSLRSQNKNQTANLVQKSFFRNTSNITE